MLPGMEGVPTPVGIDTGVMYGLIYEGLAAIPDADLVMMLADAGVNIPVSLISLLKQGLRPELPQSRDSVPERWHYPISVRWSL